ncbi:hypothetical protein [Roseinatronobacter bogoriensis]|uniref:Uncharacterized protein n=1 Tax=Roseinatronobacter bogoriensis subsp. barguzinensis TaxID=441209 RepID=A0A2K8K6J3_9RHOB|nr:hypothetical protein [Rhodobaca]ATX65082.1 hypothetical protein BG454_03925 [Rhodobaca barguzinensis]MBB4209563.1 hypothetical protein [Rhodobaca bogoriensis DSM 18756]TDW35445.1 hypothetical protein LY39_03164 [Rhodobaca barguzinensis]TDY66656.1 hypothetical protein EV660_110105 [Rhodobaca bogoriensis DSM 18756]
MTTTLFSTLRQRATGAILAAGVALGAISLPATPAQASDDALIKLLLGAAAVAIVVQAARSDRGTSQNRPQYASRELPDYCREVLRVRNRDITVYNAQCLRNAGLRNLPRQCQETVRTNRGQRSVYRATCLRNAGYFPERSAPNRGRDRHQPTPPRGGGWQGGSVLPQQCLISYRYGGQTLAGYRGACLEQRGVRDLPRTCQVRSTSGTIYSAQCLTERGYRTQRR